MNSTLQYATYKGIPPVIINYKKKEYQSTYKKLFQNKIVQQERKLSLFSKNLKQRLHPLLSTFYNLPYFAFTKTLYGHHTRKAADFYLPPSFEFFW